MATQAPHIPPTSTTLQTSVYRQLPTSSQLESIHSQNWVPVRTNGKTVYITDDGTFKIQRGMDSTGKGILIGMLSAFGSALLVALIFALIYFFRYTNRGRILLDRMGRPGEYDDEQAFAKEEAEALENMDDISRSEYLRAKGMSSKIA